MQAGEIRDLCLLHQGQDRAGRAGARRTTRTVQIALGVVSRVEVHDEADVIDVDAPSGDIGGDEHPGAPRAELVECPLPLVLV